MIWTLATKMTSFCFPENVLVLSLLGLELGLGLRLELVETRFRSNVHSGKVTRSL